MMSYRYRRPALIVALLLAACADRDRSPLGSPGQADELLAPPSAASPTQVAPAEDVPPEVAPSESPELIDVAFNDVRPGSAAWSGVTTAGGRDFAQATPAEPKAAEPQAAGGDLGALAQKANNPISDAWLLITQNDYTLLGGKAVDGPVSGVVGIRLA